MPLDLASWALAVQGLAGIVLSVHVGVALGRLALSGDVTRARLTLAAGALSALGLMTPATIVKSLSARTWEQVLALALVVSLRILLKAELAAIRLRARAEGA